MVQLNGASLVREIKPLIAMILIQFSIGGVSIFYKLAVADGMQIKILVFYRLAVAAIVILPLALVLERDRPKITWRIAFQGFLCGIFGGGLGNNLYAESMVLTSATFAAAITNIIPALTLVMAVIFRMERLNVKKSNGIAKIVGTTLSIGGAMILTLYKGITVKPWHTHLNYIHHLENAKQPKVRHNNIGGALLALASCICYSAWLIVQAKMSKSYPHYSTTFLTCFIGAIIAGVYALCTETHWTEYKLGWNIRLLSLAYTGIIGSGLVIALTTWGNEVRGPLYVSAFNPLALIFVAVLGSIILEEKLYLGSIIGAVLIIAGLYVVIWGKYKEQKTEQTRSNTTEEGTFEIKGADRIHTAKF